MISWFGLRGGDRDRTRYTCNIATLFIGYQVFTCAWVIHTGLEILRLCSTLNYGGTVLGARREMFVALGQLFGHLD